eukprot:g11540.t1
MRARVCYASTVLIKYLPLVKLSEKTTTIPRSSASHPGTLDALRISLMSRNTSLVLSCYFLQVCCIRKCSVNLSEKSTNASICGRVS